MYSRSFVLPEMVLVIQGWSNLAKILKCSLPSLTTGSLSIMLSTFTMRSSSISKISITLLASLRGLSGVLGGSGMKSTLLNLFLV